MHLAHDAADGTLRIRRRRGRGVGAAVTLDASVPWTIDVEGGLARVAADLRDVDVRHVRVTGGVHDLRLRLGMTRGAVPIELGGGVREVRLERPSRAEMSVHLHRGASDLALDETRLRAVGGGTLDVTGGARGLTVAVAVAGDGAGDADQSSPFPLDAEAMAAYPTLAALAPRLGRRDPDRTFAFGLDVLLDGLERRLAR